MAKIRVLVVDDSLTVRAKLVEVLSDDPDIEVVGQAEDGKVGIELCRSLRPDVVTLDMMMPVMTGLAATEYIMAHCPTAILVVSASINRGEVFKTLDALRAGAIDVLDKPPGDDTAADWELRFLAAVKRISRIRVITHPRGRAQTFRATGAPSSALPLAVDRIREIPQVVAIGASTGGPGAITEVLQALPSPLRHPVFVVLHISEPFGRSFTDWLDAQTPHRVSYAVDGESLAAVGGRVVMAPPGQHLVVRDGRLRLTFDPEEHACRPSVDVLFRSLAAEMNGRVIACLLTGMGRDGAAGLLALRRSGADTIAQDEATCVVYGMPREAVIVDAAVRVLPLPAIGPAIALALTGAR